MKRFVYNPGDYFRVTSCRSALFNQVFRVRSFLKRSQCVVFDHNGSEHILHVFDVAPEKNKTTQKKRKR